MSDLEAVGTPSIFRLILHSIVWRIVVNFRFELRGVFIIIDKARGVRGPSYILSVEGSLGSRTPPKKHVS